MIRLISIIIFFVPLSQSFGSEQSEVSNDQIQIQRNRMSAFALDFSINSFSNNYGLGGSISTPPFWSNNSIIRFSGTYNWVQGVPKDALTETWVPYGMLKLGLFSGGFIIGGESIRGYGGGGPVLLLPSGQVSGSSIRFGGFGLVGLEFFMQQNHLAAMYMELGGIGTGAKAEKLKNDPIYANGFLISWGFRYLI